MNNLAWGSAHMHSRYSAKDALTTVESIVEAAKMTGWGSVGLSDHGNTAGIFELYKHSKRHGLLPLPGVELYTTLDLPTAKSERKQHWMHMGLTATTNKGWENLIGLVNYTHRNFWFRPAIDFEDFRRFGEKGLLDGLWALSGCFFGVVQKTMLASPDTVAGYTAGANLLASLQEAFDGRVMVELHHHNIKAHDHDDDLQIKVLSRMAGQLGLPTLITTDSHYSHQHQQPTHDVMKKLVSWKKEDLDDAIFPGNGYWVVSADEMRRRVGDQVWDSAYEGYLHMLDGYDLVVPELDTFKARIPALASLGNGRTPEEELTARVEEASPVSPSAQQVARIHEEMSVINESGFAPYILLTQEVTDYCRDNGIRYVARGSASGSYVCYLLGITQVDPLKWKLRFDRFLSRDRSKPPDIDIDVQDDRRHEVLTYLDVNYVIMHIANWAKLKQDADDGERGSIYQLVKRYQHNSPDGAWTPKDADEVHNLARLEPYSGISKNAAGVVILDDRNMLERIPQMWIASSETMVTALDKDNLEELGYIKLDVLGSATMTQVEQMVRTSGVEVMDIPFDDKATFAMLRNGKTAGVFQFDGWTQRKNLPKLKPTKLADLALANALFRPAIINSGSSRRYLSTKSRDRRKWHRIIEAHTRDTKGFFVYQEQVIGVLRDLGMTPEELMKVLKAVKASNSGIGDAASAMRVARKEFVPLAEKHGMTEADIKHIEDAMTGYAEYSFNKSHAVSYARVSYITAWFKANHPVDFWAAVLAGAVDAKKEKMILQDMREESSPVLTLPPHVNKSGVDWTPDHHFRAVRCGLTAVQGVGKATAERIVAGAPYSSIQDFGDRLSISGTKQLQKGHSPDACGGAVASLFNRKAFNGLI